MTRAELILALVAPVAAFAVGVGVGYHHAPRQRAAAVIVGPPLTFVADDVRPTVVTIDGSSSPCFEYDGRRRSWTPCPSVAPRPRPAP